VGGCEPLQIPTLRRVAADNSAFGAVTAIRRIAKRRAAMLRFKFAYLNGGELRNLR